MSIYSLVDTLAVGQSEGPAGAAAMAIIMPIYEIQVFLAILCGIGGSILMSNAKGGKKDQRGNEYFTAAIILMSMLTILSWIGFIIFSKQILFFLGANEKSLPMVMKYAKWLIRFWPIFIFPAFLSAFIRNDGAPNLAMSAVIVGGLINVFGDWFFVFPLGMGIEGAAIATVIGTSAQAIIMSSHFLQKSCGLRLKKPFSMSKATRDILLIGLGSSLLDLGTVVLAVIINNQIMRYSDSVALAVYGVIASISSLIQALYCGVGQAIQPIVSLNYGANKRERIRTIYNMSMLLVIVIGLLLAGLGQLFPIQIMKLFMATTPRVLEMAPKIIRIYSSIYLFLGINVLSTYYLQSTMQDMASMLIAVFRSLASGMLLFVLPIFLGINGVWIAIPVSEFFIMAFSLVYIRKHTVKIKL
jgi:Na+-driven multidrug efflux pump